MGSFLFVLTVSAFSVPLSHQFSLSLPENKPRFNVHEVGRLLQERQVIGPEEIFLHQALGRERRDLTQRFPNNDAAKTRVQPSGSNTGSAATMSRASDVSNRDVSSRGLNKISPSVKTSRSRSGEGPRVNVGAEYKQSASSAAIKSSEQKQSSFDAFAETNDARSPQSHSNFKSEKNRNFGSTTHPSSGKTRSNAEYSRVPANHRQNTQNDDVYARVEHRGGNLKDLQSTWYENGIDVSNMLRQREFTDEYSAEFDLSEKQNWKRAEEEHLTRPKDQTDLGIATSMLKSQVDEIVSASKSAESGSHSAEHFHPILESKPTEPELISADVETITINYGAPVKYYYQLGSVDKPVDIDSVKNYHQTTSALKSVDAHHPNQYYQSSSAPSYINFDPSTQNYQHVPPPRMDSYQPYYDHYQYPQSYNPQSSKSGWFYGPLFDDMVPIQAKPFQPEFLGKQPESDVIVLPEHKEPLILGSPDSDFKVIADPTWSKESLLETRKCEPEPVLVVNVVPPKLDEVQPCKTHFRKSAKRPKSSRKILRKKFRDDQDFGFDEGARKKPKIRGFLRFLDALGRRSDNIADNILNRPWDRLYRNHQNSWKYEK